MIRIHEVGFRTRRRPVKQDYGAARCGIRKFAKDGTRIQNLETLNTNKNHLEWKNRIVVLKVDIIVVLIL